VVLNEWRLGGEGADARRASCGRLSSASRKSELNRWRQALVYIGRRYYRFLSTSWHFISERCHGSQSDAAANAGTGKGKRSSKTDECLDEQEREREVCQLSSTAPAVDPRGPRRTLIEEREY